MENGTVPPQAMKGADDAGQKMRLCHGISTLPSPASPPHASTWRCEASLMPYAPRWTTIIVRIVRQRSTVSRPHWQGQAERDVATAEGDREYGRTQEYQHCTRVLEGAGRCRGRVVYRNPQCLQRSCWRFAAAGLGWTSSEALSEARRRETLCPFAALGT